MKHFYTSPLLLIEVLKTEDVLTASVLLDDNDPCGYIDPKWELTITP